MTKNKKLVYILLPLTIIIWGIIAYRIATGLQEDAYEIRPKSSMPKKSDIHEAMDDSAGLLLNYTDPFLESRKLTTSKALRTSNKPIVVSRPKIKAPASTHEVQWPKIEFLGIVENKDQKVQLALIKVESQSIFLKEAETYKKIRLDKVLDDSIKVSFNSTSTFIKRSY